MVLQRAGVGPEPVIVHDEAVNRKLALPKLVHVPAGMVWWGVNLKLLDLGRVPYVSYGVKYIDPVSLCVPAGGASIPNYIAPPFVSKWRKIWI